MRLIRVLGLFSPLLILCLSGCVATQQDILALSQQTDTLNAQIQDLKKTLGSLQSNQADLSAKLGQMHADVSSLTENLKDNQTGMNRLSSKMDDLGQALGTQVSSLGQSLDQQKQMLQTKEQLHQKEEERLKKELSARQTPTDGDSAPGHMYYAALTALNKKNFTQAAQGFNSYLQKYPKGEVAELSAYYLGQAYFGQKKWEEAAKQFASVMDRYPKSDLIAPSRLNYAICLMRLKSHLDEAKNYLESIPEDYPGSAEALEAAGILKRWQKKSSSRKKHTAASPAR